MTRKEELKQLAITIVDEFPICFETETEKEGHQEYMFDMLLNVERGVLERVEYYYSTECDDAMTFSEWLKAQQQELT